jgi:ribulose-phosphate 3-epimerase
MRNLLTHPKRLPLIAPSILSADFTRMGDECLSVLGRGSGTGSALGTAGVNGADLLHLDVMDGHFVRNLTMGPDMCRAIRRAIPDVFLDVHLMVTDPWPHAKAFAEAGANHITFHIEVTDGVESWPASPATHATAFRPEGVIGLAEAIRALGCSVGLAINPPTPVERVMPYVDAVDLVLVMSVNPGFSGQAFIPEVLDKARTISEELLPTQRLQMDGGLKPSNVQQALDAGVDVVVAASAVFGVSPEQRPGIVQKLRGV